MVKYASHESKNVGSNPAGFKNSQLNIYNVLIIVKQLLEVEKII